MVMLIPTILMVILLRSQLFYGSIFVPSFQSSRLSQRTAEKILEQIYVQLPSGEEKKSLYKYVYTVVLVLQLDFNTNVDACAGHWGKCRL